MNFTREHFAPSAFLGLSPKEARSFDWPTAIEALARQDGNALAPYRQMTAELERRTGQRASTVSSILVPADVMLRDLTAGSGAGGGYLVSTNVGFAGGLFSQSLIGRLPMRPLPSTGNVAEAVATSGTASWLSTEATQTTNTDPTFGVVNGTPKTVAISVFASRHLLFATNGSRALEVLLGGKLAEAADQALLTGTGAAGQPTGLTALSGTTSVSGTALGGSGILQLIEAAEGYSFDGVIGVAGTTAARLFRTREKAAGSGMLLQDGKLYDVPLIVSRAAPADALVIAPWPTIALATWGTLEVTVTPFATPGAFQSGRVGIRLMWSLDFLPERPAAVGKSTSIT